MSFAAARPLNSEPEQDVTQNLAYHGEIGREATAVFNDAHVFRLAYHGEIGREATADCQ